MHCPSSGCDDSGNGTGTLPPVAHSNIALRGSRHSSSGSSSSGGAHGGGGGSGSGGSGSGGGGSGGGGGRPNSIGSNGSGVAAAALAAAAAMDALSNANSAWPEPEPLAAPVRVAMSATASGSGPASLWAANPSEQSQIQMQPMGAAGGRLQYDARAYINSAQNYAAGAGSVTGAVGAPPARQQRNAMSAELPPLSPTQDGVAGERRNSLPLESPAHAAAGGADSRRNSIFASAAPAPQTANNQHPVSGGAAPQLSLSAEAAGGGGFQQREKAARHRSPRDQDPRKLKQSRWGDH